jgi:hypothetical protein
MATENEKHKTMLKFVTDVTQQGTLVDIVLKNEFTAVKVSAEFLTVYNKNGLKSLDKGVILGSRFLGEYAGYEVYDEGTVLEGRRLFLKFILPEGKINLNEEQIALMTPYKKERTYSF